MRAELRRNIYISLDTQRQQLIELQDALYKQGNRIEQVATLEKLMKVIQRLRVIKRVGQLQTSPLALLLPDSLLYVISEFAPCKKSLGMFGDAN